MIAMVAALAITPVMAEETTAETVVTSPPAETTSEAPPSTTPAPEKVTIPTNDDGSVTIGVMTVRYNDDGSAVLLTTNTAISGFTFAISKGDGPGWTGVTTTKPSDGPWGGAASFVDANTGGWATKESVPADSTLLTWDATADTAQFDGLFFMQDHDENLSNRVAFEVRFVGSATTEAPPTSPRTPCKLPGHRSHTTAAAPAVAATTAAPAAGGVPRGGVALAIVPTIIAAGAAIVASKKRK